MFADDTNISSQGKTSTESFKHRLRNVHQLLISNKLTFNKKKTEYMIPGSRQRMSNLTTKPKIVLGDSAMKPVTKAKTLGVIIDENLSWNDKIQNIVTKASKGIGMMRRIKKYVPQSTLKEVYNAIVLSHLDYCSLVWDNCSEYNLHKLQKLQNRAVRVIRGRTYETSSKMF